MTETASTTPNGEQFYYPTRQDEVTELQRLQASAADHHVQGEWPTQFCNASDPAKGML